MRKDVNERVVGVLFVGHKVPVGHVRHAVLLEEFAGVLAKTSVEIFKVIRRGGVSAKFKHPRFTGLRGFDLGE